MYEIDRKMAAEILRLEDSRVTGPDSLRVTRLPAEDRGGKWEICGICDGIEPAKFKSIKRNLDRGARKEAWEECLQYVLDNTAAVRGWMGSDAWPGVEFYLRDHFFNAGAKSAAKLLQRALNVYGFRLVVDGVVGPLTREAWKIVTTWDIFCRDRQLMLSRLRAQRDDYYRSCKQFPTFGRGWLARSSEAYKFATTI